MLIVDACHIQTPHPDAASILHSRVKLLQSSGVYKTLTGLEILEVMKRKKPQCICKELIELQDHETRDN